MPDDKLLNKVFSFIAGSNEEGDDKQILLRQLAKEIQQNKYAKFYRSRQEEADPSFAQYLFGVYKLIYPIRTFLKDYAVMRKVKFVILESYLDKQTMDLIKRLTPEAIAERIKKGVDQIPSELENDLQALTAGFDNPRLTEADDCYNLMMVLYRFASWDYFSILRKFDPNISENPAAVPKFSPLGVDLIMADIAAFLSVLPSFDPNDNWKTVFDILKFCKGGADVIPFEAWNGLLANLRDLKQSKMLDTMVKLASLNPIWELKHAPDPAEQLCADWLNEKTENVRKVISDIVNNQKNTQISALEKAVFGTSETTRLVYYNKERGKILVQKELETYTFAPALNHLIAFINDFINREMQELTDILLVRGQWTKNTGSIAMSEAYHSLLEIAPEIAALDSALSEDGHDGTRLRGALLRVDRDPGQARYANSIVGTVNEEALGIINRAVPLFIVIGNHLKLLMEDCQRKPHEVIINWKELALVSKIPMAQRLTEDYKRVNYFIQLMMLEAKIELE